MRRSLTGAALCAAAMLALLVLAPDSPALLVRVAGQVYRCQPTTAAQRLTPPRAPGAGVGPLASQELGGPEVCPPGQLPTPRAIHALPPHPPVLGAKARGLPASGPQEQFGADYYYALGAASSPGSAVVTGLQGEAENQEESVDSTAGEGHSITQLWALDETSGASKYSDVEFGTISSPGFNEGKATLFVFHFDEGEPTCYDACGYVQLSNVAGRVPGYPLTGAAPLLTAGAPHLYGVFEEKGLTGKWFLAVDNETIGYYPASAWPRRAPTLLTREEVGGEVETPLADPRPATTMGDGVPGSQDASAAAPSTGPSYWRGVAERRGVTESPFQPLSLTPFESEPSVYSLGAYTGAGPETPGSSFAYGGPGWLLPAVSLSPATAATPTTATLAGTVDPRGAPSSYWFEYASNPLGAWSSTPTTDGGAGSAALAVSAPVAGLQPQSTYYYRLAATSGNGTARTREGSFVTSPSPLPPPTPPAAGVSSFVTEHAPALLRARVEKVSERAGILTVRVSVSRRSTIKLSGRGLVRSTRSLAAGTDTIRVRLTRLGRIAARAHRALAVRVVISDGTTTISKLTRART